MNARLSYREAAVEGASPVRLVILLYEQAFEDMRRALAANRRGDIEERTRFINHAILVIGYLQASLDKEQGGRVAVNLERLYTTVRLGLVDAQFRQSAAALEEQIAMLMQVHEAGARWSGLTPGPVRPLRQKPRPGPSPHHWPRRNRMLSPTAVPPQNGTHDATAWIHGAF